MKTKLKIIIPAITAIIAIIAAVILIQFSPASKNETSDISQMLSTAQKYLTEQSYEQAIAEFEKIISLEPKNAEAYIGIAEAYIGLGNTNKAVEWLEKGYELTGDQRIKAMLDDLLNSGEAEVTTTVTEAVTTAPAETAEEETTVKPAKIIVPDLSGLTRDEAAAVCEDAGIKYSITETEHESVEKGFVISQQMPAGTEVDERATLLITISSGIKAAPVYVTTESEATTTAQTLPETTVITEAETSVSATETTAATKTTTTSVTTSVTSETTETEETDAPNESVIIKEAALELVNQFIPYSEFDKPNATKKAYVDHTQGGNKSRIVYSCTYDSDGKLCRYMEVSLNSDNKPYHYLETINNSSNEYCLGFSPNGESGFIKIGGSASGFLYGMEICSHELLRTLEGSAFKEKKDDNIFVSDMQGRTVSVSYDGDSISKINVTITTDFEQSYELSYNNNSKMYELKYNNYDIYSSVTEGCPSDVNLSTFTPPITVYDYYNSDEYEQFMSSRMY